MLGCCLHRLAVESKITVTDRDLHRFTILDAPSQNLFGERILHVSLNDTL